MISLTRIKDTLQFSQFSSFSSIFKRMSSNKGSCNKGPCITDEACSAEFHWFCKGKVHLYPVTYKCRNFKSPQDDRDVQVSMCKLHYDWLIKKGDHVNKDTGKLEMRGKFEDEALYDDLFLTTFGDRAYDISSIFKVLVAEYSVEGEEYKTKRFLLNDKHIDVFKHMLTKEATASGSYIYIKEVGAFHVDGSFVFELKDIYDTDVDAIVELENYYIPVFDGEWVMRNVSSSAYESHWQARVAPENPTLETEFNIRPIPSAITAYFKNKQREANFAEFKECVAFIECNIDPNIVNWQEIHKQTDDELFENVNILINALLTDKTDTVLKNQPLLLTPEVLWVVYVLANHLFYSQNERKHLRTNTLLIDLFAWCRLEKQLLALAISGERERNLGSKQREHHDILYENEFVVKTLVPAYVSPSDHIYTQTVDDQVSEKLTPLEYWHYYSNTTYIIGFHSEQREFKKNEEIRAYLEK